MKHAFGIGSLTPFSEPAPGGVTEASLSPFIWYWGATTTKSNDGGFVNPFVYRVMHYAGPTLTAANVKKGLFAAPLEENGTAGGALGYGNAAGLPYPSYALFGFEAAMIWWNPTQTGPGNAVGTDGTGKYMYLSEGKRFRYNEFPKTQPQFFDAKASAALVPLATKFPGDTIPAVDSVHGVPEPGESADPLQRSGVRSRVIAQPCRDPLEAPRRARMVGFVQVAVSGVELRSTVRRPPPPECVGVGLTGRGRRRRRS